MVSRHDTVAFLTSHKLYLLAVVYAKVGDEDLTSLSNAIKTETGVDLGRHDLFNITSEEIDRIRKFEGEKHGYLNALTHSSIYHDDKRKADIKTLNFKFLIITIGIIFALIWFTLFLFVEVPPENAKFVDAGIGMLTSLVGCFVYGYFKDNQHDKK